MSLQIIPIVEFYPIARTLSRKGARWEIADATQPSVHPLRNQLRAAHGLYIFYNSQGNAICVGKAKRLNLWIEMKSAFNRAGMLNNNTIRYNREDGVIVTAGGIATIDDNTIAENGGHGVNAYLGSLLVLHGNVISENRLSGVVGYAHATVQIGGATIRDNRGGAGISMMYGSKLMLEAPTTTSQGNIGALWCGDQESSVNDLGLLDAGGDTVFCTGY